MAKLYKFCGYSHWYSSGYIVSARWLLTEVTLVIFLEPVDGILKTFLTY